MNLEKYNFHWKENFFYNVVKKRDLYFEIAKKIEERQIVSLIGLRRVGKTTILKQIIDFLIKDKKAKRENILYFSFDEEEIKIEAIINEYESKLGSALIDSKEKFFIFFDEIQKLDNWQGQIKYYYDNYKNIKFLISGSSSLFIKNDSRESLAGRIYEFMLYPLSFREFLILKDKEELILKKKLLDDSLKKEFSYYIKRQFIEIIDKNEDIISEYMRSILEKVIYQDIPKIYPIENEDLLFKIMRIVSSNPGIFSDYQALSKELGINRLTLSNYFFYLEESFLLKKIYNFSRNMLTSEKKLKRFYLSSSSFFVHLNNSIDESKIIENLVISEIQNKFFWRDPFKNEVDIITSKNNLIIPIEVKYKNNVGMKDIKGLLKFCDVFKCKKAIVITKNLLKKHDIKLKNGMKLKINYIPAYLFLLEINPKTLNTN